MYYLVGPYFTLLLFDYSSLITFYNQTSFHLGSQGVTFDQLQKVSNYEYEIMLSSIPRVHTSHSAFLNCNHILWVEEIVPLHRRGKSRHWDRKQIIECHWRFKCHSRALVYIFQIQGQIKTVSIRSPLPCVFQHHGQVKAFPRSTCAVMGIKDKHW